MGKNDKTLEKLSKEALAPVEEHPYQVPGNWVWVYTPYLFDIEYGKNLPTSQLKETGYPVFGANGQIGYYDEYTYEEPKVLVSCRGANSGTINISLCKSFITNNSLVLSEKYDMSVEFVQYLFESVEKGTLISGSAQPQITLKAFTKFPLPIPPYDEQQRIVSKIESLFSKIDKAKELIEEAREGFENRKAAILAKAFRGELTRKWREENTNIPSAEEVLKNISVKKRHIVNYECLKEIPYKLPMNWKWIRLGELIDKIDAGKNFTCPDIPVDKGKVGIVKISAVTWGKFNHKETKTVEDKSKINPSYFIKKGDFLISRANTIELVGASVVVDEIDYDIMISDKVWRVNFLLDVQSYVNYYLKTIYGRKEIEDRATGNQLSMRNISQKSFEKILIPFPPLEEAEEIVNILNRLSIKETEIEELTQLEDQIELLKKSILSRAFRGELGTNDPTEESTLELLKEILEEKIK